MEKNRRLIWVVLVSSCITANAALGQVSGGVPGGVPSHDTTSAQPNEWKPFAPDGAGFSVLVPGTPVGGERTLHPQPGVQMRTPVYILHSGTIEYIIGYQTVGVQVEDEAFAKDLFDRTRDSAIARMHAKVLDEQEVKVDGWLGRRMKLTASNTYLEMLAVLADYKLINLIIETHVDTETPELETSAAKFFASLSIQKRLK
jgi:hypothetical protein